MDIVKTATQELVQQERARNELSRRKELHRRPSPTPHPRRDNEKPAATRPGVRKPHPWVAGIAARVRGEKGMSTAEYAVGTLAAVAFAGVLLNVLTSGAVQSAVTALITKALS